MTSVAAQNGPAIGGRRSYRLVTAAARCWRVARDGGKPVQQRLHAMLSPGGGMLAPVLDSLLTLFEAALGRPVATGGAARLSADERLLLQLLDGSKTSRACIDCPESSACALDTALCSTRIMIAFERMR